MIVWSLDDAVYPAVDQSRVVGGVIPVTDTDSSTLPSSDSRLTDDSFSARTARKCELNTRKQVYRI